MYEGVSQLWGRKRDLSSQKVTVIHVVVSGDTTWPRCSGDLSARLSRRLPQSQHWNRRVIGKNAHRDLKNDRTPTTKGGLRAGRCRAPLTLPELPRARRCQGWTRRAAPRPGDAEQRSSFPKGAHTPGSLGDSSDGPGGTGTRRGHRDTAGGQGHAGGDRDTAEGQGHGGGDRDTPGVAAPARGTPALPGAMRGTGPKRLQRGAAGDAQRTGHTPGTGRALPGPPPRPAHRGWRR